MNKKLSALLLSAFVLPGLGQFYLGRKIVGGILILLVNLILLLALFVLLKGLSPVIAARIASGTISITPSEVMNSLQLASGLGKAVLFAFCIVWLISVIDILKPESDNKKYSNPVSKDESV